MEFSGIPEQTRSDKCKSIKGASHLGVFSNTGQHWRNPTLGAVLEINALTLCIANGLKKPLSILIFLMLVSNICWICSFVFNGSVSKPAFFGEQCPKDETW